MRLISYEYKGIPGFGAVQEDRVLELTGYGDSLRDSITAILEDGAQSVLSKGSDLCSLADVTLSPPIPNPRKMVITGWNYRSHADETDKEVPKEPMVLARWADTMVGHGQELLKPSTSDTYDYEGELAVVIGKPGRRISRERAYEHVFGFSCFMEGSVREYQQHSHTAGKNFYQTGAFGPWIVTSDEVDPTNLELRTILNGEVVQETNTGLMVYDIPHLIAHLSEFAPLSPGDVIVTGTPAGVGARRNPPLWLKAGDLIEVEIDGIGRLSNSVVQE